MDPRYNISCCWSGRFESDDQFAQRAAAWFQELSQIDPLLQRWCEGGKRNIAEAAEVRPTLETLRNLFTRKPYKDEMGITLLLVNQQPEPDRCSTYMTSGWSAGNYPAMCSLDPPYKGDFAERLLTTGVLERVLRAMARVWEPEHGIAESTTYWRFIEDDRKKIPAVRAGWLTYLSRKRGEIPPLPAPVRVEPVENKGNLIILTQERFTASNPEHVKLGLEVHRILNEAGLLQPVA